jgi:mono/diheme cytochrome c family protein
MNTRNRFAASVIGGVIALLAISPLASAQKNRSTPPRIVTWNCSGCHEVNGNAQLPEPCRARRVIHRTEDCGLSGSARPAI